MKLDQYNVVWETQSRNSGESMPCGGYDIGANVWVEENALYLYIDRSGYFDEHNHMLKTGRYHFRFGEGENPFGRAFRQELKLLEGCVVITGEACRITVRMDTETPLCVVRMELLRPMEVTAVYESWRTEDTLVPPESRHAMASLVADPGDVYTWKDQIVQENGRILFYHKNKNDRLLFDRLIREQNLEAVGERFYNPQKNFIFGGAFTGVHVRDGGNERGTYAGIPYVGYSLISETCDSHEFRICFYSGHESEESFLKELGSRVCKAWVGDNSYEAVCRRAEDWWRQYWERSYIYIPKGREEAEDSKEEIAQRERVTAHQIARNYTLFRYMMGCNARGAYPTKFNGGLFTTDACYSVGEEHVGKTPDFRMWGGGSFTAQNQRMLYWGLLASGDFDLMCQQFDFYNRLLGNAELRTQEYWGHQGCSFTEQLEDIGLPILWNWGMKQTEDTFHLRPRHFDWTEQRGPWIKYHYSTQLEFAYMILEYHRYSGEDIEQYVPFIESCVRFYFEHYRMLNFENACKEYDENGKLVIFPSTALETYKNACNPIDAVAGLTAVVGALMELPQYVDTEYYKELFCHIPELPKTVWKGEEILAPAEFWKGRINCELPQLYPVFPYHFYGVGKEHLDVAVRTWNAVPADSDQRNHVSWHQDGIFAARMGLAEEAKVQIQKKLGNSGRRFPAFWGPGHDWVPDHNWGGSGMIALQEMLVQESDGCIYLFPAWPREWDVECRLHLPGNRVLHLKKEGNRVRYEIEGEAVRKVVNCLYA